MSLLGVAILVSYLLGSIPAAYLAGKARGVDLRRHGSGNLGATNVIRVLGMRIGLAVFAFDMAKGAVPVVVFSRWLPPTLLPIQDGPTVVGLLCGLAAIVGHVRPVYLGFGRGGKGVATAAGVFLALAPIQTLLALVIFAVVLLSSGYVSLGSLTSVFWTHRANIVRLRNGDEHRFGKRGERRRRPATLIAIGLVVALAVLIAMRFG
jgi:glycerol-3-phosphate acyltransferase PlsY